MIRFVSIVYFKQVLFKINAFVQRDVKTIFWILFTAIFTLAVSPHLFGILKVTLTIFKEALVYFFKSSISDHFLFPSFLQILNSLFIALFFLR